MGANPRGYVGPATWLVRAKPRPERAPWGGRPRSWQVADAGPCVRCSRPGRGPFGLCSPCSRPLWPVLGQLQRHHVAADLALALLDDPRCAGCLAGLLGDPPLLVVDHDHRCCDPGPSCGRCVRGFLCPPCNWAEGWLNGDPARADRLAAYLRAACKRLGG